MPTNLSNFDQALKDVYGPRIEEQLNLLNVLSDWIEENDSADWTGRRVTYPIHVSRNQGVGASAEGDPLPVAGNEGFATVIIPERYNYGTVQFTKQVMQNSLQNKGAFARAMEYGMTGLVRSLSNDRERQAFGAGTGILALVNAAQPMAATTTLVVDSPYGVSPTTNGARFLNPGMFVAVLDPSSATVEGAFTVSAIASNGNSITINSTLAVTFSDNARIVRANSTVSAGTTNNFNKECMGLLGLIDDGTYLNTMHNVNRTTFPVFSSKVISNVGQLSLDVIQRGIDATDELGGGNFGTSGIFFCHHSVRREYLKLLEADRRYTGGDLRAPDGGTKQAALRRGGEITYGDRPWRTAKHAPYATLFGIQKNQITRYINIRGEWSDEGGAVLKWVPGYDQWLAFYRIFDELHTDRPNDGFRLDGITATVGSPNHIF